MQNLKKKKKKNPKLTEMESRFLVGRGRGWEEQAKRVKEYRLPVLRWVSSGDSMYNIVTISTGYAVGKRSHMDRAALENEITLKKCLHRELRHCSRVSPWIPDIWGPRHKTEAFLELPAQPQMRAADISWRRANPSSLSPAQAPDPQDCCLKPLNFGWVVKQQDWAVFFLRGRGIM